MKIGTLNVGVRTFTQRTAGPNGRQKQLTEIFVRMGNIVVADRTIPGRWNTVQALAEFRRFPDRFTPRSTFTGATLKGIAA